MKKTEGYIVKELEDEYIVLPVGERTEEVNEVGNEYGIEASEVYEDVKNVVKTFREKGILL